MKRAALTRLSFVFSMAVFGTISLFVRGINLSSAELALFRAVLAFGLLGIYLLLTKTNPVRGLNRKNLLLLLFSGAAMGFNWIMLFEAYRHTTVSLATISYYFAPVLVTILSPLLFREKMTPRQIVCFLGSTLGVVLILGEGGADTGNHLFGVALGLGAAVLYATVMLCNKYIKDVSGVPRTFWQFLAAATVLLPYVLLRGGFDVASLNGQGLACLLTVGLLHTGITYCLYFSALWRLPGQEAAILSYIDPLVAVILSVCVLHEPISLLQIAGGVLVLGCSLFNELPTEKQPKT